MRKFLIATATLAALVTCSAAVTASAADAPTPPRLSWSFDGPFGTFDRAALQRGFQVYREVCSNCHSMKYLTYGDLTQIGYTEAQVKAIAASVKVQDGPNKEGNMFERPGRPSDHFKSPFPNEEAARANFGGALPPDFSLIAKARKYGPDYIVAILTGFRNPPAGVKVPPGRYYNTYFPGHMIAMPPPLTDGAVTYADGTKASVHQMARDVATFLVWASDPSLEERHQLGFKVIVFLVILAGIFYFAKKRIWADVH